MAVVVNFNSGNNMGSALAYAQGKGHKDKLADSFGVGCSTDRPARDFANTQFAYGRGEDKTKIHRMELSFANNDNTGKCEINKYDAKEYVKKFVDKYEEALGGDFQCYVGFHQDSEHYHAHLIFNAINTRGKKYRPRFNEIKYSRKLNDDLAHKYNLHVVRRRRAIDDHEPKGRKNDGFYEKYGRLPYSYKAHARQLISRALLKSRNLNDFGYWMSRQGCKVMPNFYNDKVKNASIVMPNYYRSGYRNCKNPFRTVKTSRLGYTFEKYFLRNAATGNLDDNLMKLYKILSKDSKHVQVFRYQNQHEREADTRNKPIITAKIRTRNVPYKDRKLNDFDKIKSNHKLIMRKDPVNYNRNTYNNDDYNSTNSIYNKSHSSSPSPLTLKGMTREEREEVLNAYKIVNDIYSSLDNIFTSIGSIFKTFQKHLERRYHSFNEENNKINNHIKRTSHKPDPLAEFRGMDINQTKKAIADMAKDTPDKRFQQDKFNYDRNSKRIKEQERNKNKRKVNRKFHFHL